MIKVIYCKDGKPISDFDVYEAVDKLIEEHNNSGDTITVKTSSEMLFDVFNLRTMEGKISVDEIEFYANDEKLDFDIYDGASMPKNKNNTLGLFAEITEKCCKVGCSNWKRDNDET